MKRVINHIEFQALNDNREDVTRRIVCSANYKEDNGNTQIQLVLKNNGNESCSIENFWFDILMENSNQKVQRSIGEADNYFICHASSENENEMIIITPQADTQLDFAEVLEHNKTAVYRAYICAAERKQELAQDGRIWRTPSAKIILKELEKREFHFTVFIRKSLQQIAEELLTMGFVSNQIVPGINGMRLVAHPFYNIQKPVKRFTEQSNAYQSITICGGRLSSLVKTGCDVEAIDPEAGFGDVILKLEDGSELSTLDRLPIEKSSGETLFEFAEASVATNFVLNGPTVRFALKIKNITRKQIVIKDLIVPFRMNSEMAWGVSPEERVLRHSQVAGDNSFFLYTPCSGAAPYLLCMPEKGTRLELFDLNTDLGKKANEQNRMFRVFIHGAGEACTARKNGGEWRQPTTSKTLEAGESCEYAFDFKWVGSYDEAREELVKNGKIDIKAVPGLTVPRNQTAKLRVRHHYDNLEVLPEFARETKINLISVKDDTYIYDVKFNKLGENKLTLKYGDGLYGIIEFFITLPIPELIEKRADYIRRNQIRDKTKWYDGLFRDRNSRTGAILDPDHHDEITDWREYAITCDDPGLSKPAFLAAKNAESMVPKEVESLDYYIENFVWGKLQRTDQEEYPYGIYGIPDWHYLRNLKNLNSQEAFHIWRIYDYPHIALLYFSMYKIAKANPELEMKQDAQTYLERAYGTYLAMYQYAYEIAHWYDWNNGHWSPYCTGFYNELVIVDTIEALTLEGFYEKAQRLTYHWQHKADFFIRENKDLFSSELAFDTTGFETTQAIVDWARNHALDCYLSDPRSVNGYKSSEVERFALRQRNCNIACRGNVENAYYITGSDIRSDSAAYTLSYMSQMGGWSLLEDALYGVEPPFELLRLGYTSYLSSWALINAGDKESNYGYWNPGKENDGASSGGFEASPYGYTWLGPKHHRGVWPYDCETDLGYCGGLRGAAAILAEDPEFGRVCYGGVLTERKKEFVIEPSDGVQRRFHWLMKEERVHIILENANFEKIIIKEDYKIEITLCKTAAAPAFMKIHTHTGKHNLKVEGGTVLKEAFVKNGLSVRLNPGEEKILVTVL